MASLRDLLKAELKTLDGPQVTRFKRELAKRLPQTVKEAAKLAKQAPEKPAAGGMSGNVREK